jgi:hypothetical protein
MRRLLIKLAISAAILVMAGVFLWFGALYGWFGSSEGPGVIEGKALPAEVVAARGQSQKPVAPASDDSLILFGDLHVHTTLSVDAFQFSLPILGGQGAYPLSDACDFARYCSAMDFWASTDHAESITAQRWRMIKDAVRSCQKVSGNTAEPDLVSFIGFEWTQVGRTPDTHFGHKNVIFRDLEDDKVSKRAIAAIGRQSSQSRGIANSMSPLVPLRDFQHRQRYFDYNRFITDTREAEMCAVDKNSADLPESCMEYATTPGELARKLFDEQKLQPLIIPHGTTWGFYTPAGTTWYQVAPRREPPAGLPPDRTLLRPWQLGRVPLLGRRDDRLRRHEVLSEPRFRLHAGMLARGRTRPGTLPARPASRPMNALGVRP